jgi:phasin family protein
MAVKLSRGNLSGTALPAGEAEEALAAAVRDVAVPESVTAVDAFIAALKQALKSLRTARGMTQGALAEAVGVSTSTVSRLEGDAATPIDLATLGGILQRLNVGLRCELQVDAPSFEIAVRPSREEATVDLPKRSFACTPEDERSDIADVLTMTDSIVASQKKNVEALVAANRTAVEGMQSVMRRQAEILQETMSEMTKAFQNLGKGASSPQEPVADQADIARKVFETSLANMRELAEMVTKSQNEGTGSRRVTTSLPTAESLAIAEELAQIKDQIATIQQTLTGKMQAHEKMEP